MADIAEILANSASNLAAAFLGAYLAFHSERRRRKDEERRQHVASIQAALAQVLWARNAVYTVRTQVLEPVRNHPYRHVVAGARLNQDEPRPLDVSVATLPNDAGIMTAIFQAASAVESARVTVRMMNMYSACHAGQYQPSLAASNAFQGQQHANVEDILAHVPPHVIATMKRYFDEFAESTEHARENLIRAQHQLIAAAKKVFPEEKFMRASIPDDRHIEQECSNSGVASAV